MTRFKTLSLPLVSGLLASSVMPTAADVAMTLSSNITYRQTKKGTVAFRGGDFDVRVRDGNGIYVSGCYDSQYWPPNPLIACSGGSTGQVIFGSPDDAFGPYFWFTDVIPAVAIEPREPELCLLKAAPASKLPRPDGGFKDSSYGLYYNLHVSPFRESVITRYDYNRTYSSKQLGKFQEEIVPGVYHYAFPRLKNSKLTVPISPVIYPMAEGYTKKNNQKVGVKFTANDRWTKAGFMELSYNKANVIKWSGFSPSAVFPGVDGLYFSMRFLSNPKDPLSDVTYTNPDTGESPASFFPTFVNGADPRVRLTNPFVDSFTIPPVFPGGSKAVIELELDRSFQTGFVTYDFSTRKFQIPVVIVDRYTDYAEMRFGSLTKKYTGILDDYDKDGFNNLNEWILDSRAEDSTSIPEELLAENHPAELTITDYVPQYFGFTVSKKHGTVPLVKYTLQRSTNKGITWKKFESTAVWTVTETKDGFVVESMFVDDNGTPNNLFDDFWGQPPGTEGDLYRLKITLAK